MSEYRPMAQALWLALIPAAWGSQVLAAGMQAGGAPGGLRSPDGIPIIQVYEDPGAPNPPTAVPSPGGGRYTDAPPVRSTPRPSQGGQRRSGGAGMGSGRSYPRGSSPDWPVDPGFPVPRWGDESTAPMFPESVPGAMPYTPWLIEGEPQGWAPTQEPMPAQAPPSYYPPPPMPGAGYAPLDYSEFEAETELLPEALGEPMPVPEYPVGAYPFEFPQASEPSELPIPQGEGFGLPPQSAWPPMAPFGYRAGPGHRGLPPGYYPSTGGVGPAGAVEQRLQRIEGLLQEILDNQRRGLQDR